MQYLMPLIVIFALIVVGLPLYKNHQKNAKEREFLDNLNTINSIRNITR